MYESRAMHVARARTQSNNYKQCHQIKEKESGSIGNLYIHVCYVSFCWVRVFSL